MVFLKGVKYYNTCFIAKLILKKYYITTIKCIYIYVFKLLIGIKQGCLLWLKCDLLF